MQTKRRVLPPADEHAAHFERQREADRVSVTEDYVELIAALLHEQGEARATDLARRVGVAPPTVAATIGRLRRAGLVQSRPYRGLFLTEAGHAMAEASRQRHELLVRLLIAVGVDPETAEADAEGLEHHASEKALTAFSRFLANREES